MPCAAHSASTSRMTDRFGVHAATSRRRHGAAIAHVITPYLAEVGVVSVRARVSPDALFSLIRAAVVTRRSMLARVSARESVGKHTAPS